MFGISLFYLSAVDRWFVSRPGQTKDCKNGISCFSSKHTALRSKSKDWLARIQVLIFGILMPHSAIFQLYHGDQF
jgi:hypothetical protein